jgi:hypothetical protein
MPLAPARHPPPRSLRSASRALAEPRRVAAEGREGLGGLGGVPSADEVGGQSPAPPTREKHGGAQLILGGSPR